MLDWLCAGSQKNYHDGASLMALAVAMPRVERIDEGDVGSFSSSTSGSEKEKVNVLFGKSNMMDDGGQEVVQSPNTLGIKKNVTLCLYCCDLLQLCAQAFETNSVNARETAGPINVFVHGGFMSNMTDIINPCILLRMAVAPSWQGLL